MSGRKTVIVTGGAGYLGRCAVEVLRTAGYRAVVVDNFSTGNRDSVRGVDYFDVDLTDRKASERVFHEIQTASAVLHFAARALICESTERPYEYFFNNVTATLTVADLCAQFGIHRFVHSSSCSVYGVPERLPIAETCLCDPMSPYGESKCLSERILAQYERLGKIGVVNLRYFNPAGAINGFGERHDPETHLIPNVLSALVSGSSVSVFGNDYSTPDGTCIRDFIHVHDLMEAHVRAIEYRLDTPATINIGSGRGYSVMEVIRAAESITGKSAKIRWQPRRAADPSCLIADIASARRLLNWAPLLGLSEMVRDHFNFMQGAK